MRLQWEFEKLQRRQVFKSSLSNDNGRAFEYACIVRLADAISAYRDVVIDEESILAARRTWDTMTTIARENFLRAADAFIETLFDAEPLILEQEDEDDILTLSINKDSDAEDGDVRDIVITRNFIRWDIGLSMKHNHFASKHSRLSPTIDFGQKWCGIPCDESYWEQVLPLFDELRELKNRGVEWNQLVESTR